MNKTKQKKIKGRTVTLDDFVTKKDFSQFIHSLVQALEQSVQRLNQSSLLDGGRGVQNRRVGAWQVASKRKGWGLQRANRVYAQFARLNSAGKRSSTRRTPQGVRA